MNWYSFVISYHDGMNITGIVYLHDICLPRCTGTILKNLDMFKKLCGDDALRNVVLGTTKWSLINRRETGEKREQQLRDSIWKEMINHGSVIRRVGRDRSSAMEILDHILQNKPIESLLIQKEVVDEQIPIPETTAGKTRDYTQKQPETLKKKREKSRQMGKDVDKRMPIPETTARKTLRYTQEQFKELKKKREKSRQMGKDV